MHGFPASPAFSAVSPPRAGSGGGYSSPAARAAPFSARSPLYAHSPAPYAHQQAQVRTVHHVLSQLASHVTHVVTRCPPAEPGPAGAVLAVPAPAPPAPLLTLARATGQYRLRVHFCFIE